MQEILKKVQGVYGKVQLTASCNKRIEMARTQSINITKPCHELWQQMVPVDGGRHCQSCCKTVIDFSAMTEAQVIGYLGRQQNVCGRFEDRQLIRINQQFQKKKPTPFIFFKRMGLVAAVLMAIPFARANAQKEYKMEYAPTKSKRHGAGLPKAQTHTNVKINTDAPIQAVSVKQIGTEDYVRHEVVGGVSVQGITIRRVLYRAWDKTKWVFGGN
ncbi:hypothetical protein PQ469_10780 [Mucilaginibacter sp. KACC 22773]|jgi:hypothetical protein|uniref:hypothetical protein n=1 Tax=Mucilaginibacter sp. KACC 22773 TaxID=3025671 RepID=UPI0023659CC1|nr:hypothetical protein [Mucilaginibacter sp. KACC 22773]WDF80490.1 hypothetical protein PQ469_10780 [Mucilaginibacter sp. KACC 22773]